MSETERAHRFGVRHWGTWATLLVASSLALLAAFVLSIDAWKLAKDPNVKLACNINATLNCGKVAEAWQSVIFGFPNAFLGIIAETVIVTVAVAALAGARFRKGFMVLAEAMVFLGLVFAYWMFYQSYFHIGALCPWCLVVTFTTTTVFMTMVRINILDNNFRLPPRLHARLSRLLQLNADTATVFILWAVLASLILFHYA